MGEPLNNNFDIDDTETRRLHASVYGVPEIEQMTEEQIKQAGVELSTAYQYAKSIFGGSDNEVEKSIVRILGYEEDALLSELDSETAETVRHEAQLSAEAAIRNYRRK